MLILYSRFIEKCDHLLRTLFHSGLSEIQATYCMYAIAGVTAIAVVLLVVDMLFILRKDRRY